MATKFKRFQTEYIELKGENRNIGLDLIGHRQNIVEGIKEKIEDLLQQMKEKCPELNAEIIIQEQRLKKQKKFLKDTLSGAKFGRVYADVIIQPSATPGYLDFIENGLGTGEILKTEPGTADEIDTEE